MMEMPTTASIAVDGDLDRGLALDAVAVADAELESDVGESLPAVVVAASEDDADIEDDEEAEDDIEVAVAITPAPLKVVLASSTKVVLPSANWAPPSTPYGHTAASIF